MSVADLAGVIVGRGNPVRIMAALNVSPESFYAGSVRLDGAALRDAAQQAVADGADIVDIGAMTTAPYLHGEVAEEEEARRLRQATEIVAAAVGIPISADTQRAAVAAAALAAGATIVNDVSGLRGDPLMGALAARARGVVLTASQLGADGTSGVPLAVVRRLLQDSLGRARDAGVDLCHIVLDPGIGFFTQADVSPALFSCTVLAQLDALSDLDHPLLVGVSRKSFIAKISGRPNTEDRLWGSLSATAIAVFNGAALIRTHDVAATRDVVRLAEAIRRQRP